MIARKFGSRPRPRADHFAHARDVACVGALETALHKLAKQILTDALGLTLPAIAAEREGVRRQSHDARHQAFEAAAAEVAFPGVVADVVLRRGERALIVEILVTHASDAEKVARIRRLETSAIEIDLSKLSRRADPETVSDAVLVSAPRKWLFNPAQDAVDAEVDQVLAERAEVARQKLLRQAQTLVGHWAALPSPRDGTDLPAVRSALVQIEALNFAAHVGLPVARGEKALNVSPKAWQAVVLKTLVIDQQPWFGRPGLSIPALRDRLEGHGLLPPLFKVSRGAELIGAARALAPDFNTPTGLISAYVRGLQKAGLVECADDLWRAPIKVRQQIAQQARETRERQDRIDDLRTRVDEILKRAGPEGEGFDRQAWLGRAHRSRPPPLTVAANGGPVWSELKAAFARIADAFWTYDDAVDLMGLPLRAALERAEQARKDAAERRRLAAEAAALAAADDREARFRAAALAAYGADAEAWMTRLAPPANLSTRLALVRSSSTHLQAALEALDRRVAQQRREEAQRVMAQDALAALWDAACDEHGEDWAKVFVSNPDPRLGGRRPREVCVDPASLKMCLNLVRPKLASRRRG
ncbi:MAG: hypothetical protein DI526_20710 [Caulobacter segnis]|uniref:Antitoxin Xre/MbcA/ParS-like toxin-binding domain-containing protein n=1 Tax=Caulobacter segnis TaxID=88688 RepID=A0A2W5UZN5_9CAUL|nr:MAG: hypothetical protein DI526_20710 [Caulobacter segnis]